MPTDEPGDHLGAGLFRCQAGHAVNDLFGQSVTPWRRRYRDGLRNTCAATGKSTPVAGSIQIERRTILPLLRSVATWCSLPGTASASTATIWALTMASECSIAECHRVPYGLAVHGHPDQHREHGHRRRRTSPTTHPAWLARIGQPAQHLHQSTHTSNASSRRHTSTRRTRILDMRH